MPGTKGWIGLPSGSGTAGGAIFLYSKAVKHLTALETILIPVLEPAQSRSGISTIGEVPYHGICGWRCGFGCDYRLVQHPGYQKQANEDRRAGSMNSNASDLDMV